MNLDSMIFCLGSINADLTFGGIADMAAGGTIRTGQFHQRAGGMAANSAYFIHCLGVPVQLLGRVGDDHFGKIALNPLRKAGLPLDGVSIAEGEFTGVAVIAVAKDGNKTMLSASNANNSWPKEAVAAVVQRIMLAPDGSMLVADFEVPRSVLEAAFDACERRGFDIVVDPTFPEEMRKPDFSRLRAITPNAQEASALVGTQVSDEASAREAARVLNEWGVDIACLKLPEGGCIAAKGNELFTIHAPKVEVVDKTGAGDAFVGALSIALLRGLPFGEAARWGVAASSISVKRSGAQESFPPAEEFNRMLEVVRAAA
ncbi:ribokinase [Sinorhizobium arboris]|uniref:ribokinase n=1 Tax=Sinorhizobium arboris TaxID=76745 RepID=UPI001243181A|nr:ribokinase [Sinorhizobium arboris]